MTAGEGRGGRPATLGRLSSLPGWRFFAALWRARPDLTVAWWALLVLGAGLPPLFAVLTGRVAGALTDGSRADVTGLVVVVAGCFVLLQVAPQVATAVSVSLGSTLAGTLDDRLLRTALRPPGIAHLDDAELVPDLAGARDVVTGRGGAPPLHLAVDFARGSLLQLLVGLVSTVVLAVYAWWAALTLLVAWSSTHVLLRASARWAERHDRDTNLLRQHADYAYSLATDPAAAKELRLFDLAGWAVDRFARRRRELHDAQFTATRLAALPLALAALVLVAANVAVLGTMARWTLDGVWGTDQVVTAAQLALGVQWVAFGALSWAMDDAAAGVVAVEAVERGLGDAGALTSGSRPAPGSAVSLELRDVRFRYPTGRADVYAGLSLAVPAGTSLAVVGVNGAGKTTLAKLLCRFYDPTEGTVLVDGTDLTELDLDDWRRRVAAVFQDFARFERSLRDNVDPGGCCTDEEVLDALRAAGAAGLADLGTPMSAGLPGGVDLSGGQWQRVALARVLCGVRRGAGLVVLDEPTAHLDAVGESTVFETLLRETTEVTTVLISHRLSTVRGADRIAVVEGGRVTELGTHDDLVARGGTYAAMFELQARRFLEEHDDEGARYDRLD